MIITLCAGVSYTWAQDASASTPTANIAADTAADTSAGTPATDTAADAAATSANAPTEIAEEAAAGTPEQATVDKDGDDLSQQKRDEFDDDDDDERILAEIALDTKTEKKPDLIRREYNYSRQTRLAIVMMVFIALALSTTQSWNPR